MNFKIKRNFFLIFLSLIIIVAALGYYYFFSGRFLFKKQVSKADLTSPDRLFTVQRGDLPIGISIAGTVNAKTKHKLALEPNVKTTLSWVAPENTVVKQGEVIARFDTEDLQQKIQDLELNLQTLLKEMDIAREEISIQKSANEADIKVALDNLRDAEAAYVKYRKLEGPKDSDAQKLKVEDAEKKYKDEKVIYDDLQRSFKDTVFMDEDARKKSLEKILAQEKKVDSEEIAYNNALIDRKIFKRFTYPDKLRQLANKVEQEKLNLQRAQVRASSLLLQKENQLAKVDAQVKKIQYDLEKHKSYMDKMQLVAPVDGVVTYGDPDRRWGGPEVKVGMEVRPREVLLTIPEMSNLVVEFDLPEQYRARIKLNDPAVIRPDSVPGMKIEGKISQIALTPVNQIHWDRNSPRIYPSKIELLEQPEALVSGMSVQIQIVTDTLKDVIFVPVEAVFDEGGKFFVFLKKNGQAEEREVEIGESNDYYIEIKKGLKEGDIVFLYRPFQK